MPPESCALSDGGRFKTATIITSGITGVLWCVVLKFEMVATQTTGKLKMISTKNTTCPPNFMHVTQK